MQLHSTPRPAALTPRPSPLTPLRQSPFEPVEAEQSGVPDSWEGVCDWVLGKRLDLWQELFEQPFLKVQHDSISLVSGVVTGSPSSARPYQGSCFVTEHIQSFCLLFPHCAGP